MGDDGAIAFVGGPYPAARLVWRHFASVALAGSALPRPGRAATPASGDGVAQAVRSQQSGRSRRGCCSCACYSGVRGERWRRPSRRQSARRRRAASPGRTGSGGRPSRCGSWRPEAVVSGVPGCAGWATAPRRESQGGECCCRMGDERMPSVQKGLLRASRLKLGTRFGC